MMPSLVRQLRMDYLALRDMGLISMPPGEIHNVIVTTLGVEVLCRITPLDPRVVEEAGKRRLTTPSAAEPRCEPQVVRGVEEAPVSATSRVPVGQPAAIAALPRVVTLDYASIDTVDGSTVPDLAVPAGGSAQLEFVVPAQQRFDAIIVTSNPRRGLDPFLTLLGPDNNILDEDDDSGGELNSRIARSLGPGRYRVRLTDFASGSGTATVTVRQTQPAERLSALAIRGAALDADLLELAADTTVCQQFIEPSNAATLELDTGNRLLRCQITESGRWNFDARSSGRGALEMALYSVGTDGSTARLVATSEDNGGPLRQRITSQLRPGQFVLRVRQRGLVRVPHLELRISRTEP